MLKNEIINVTPEIASSILGNNKKNRPISSPTVNRYTTLMLDGKWHFNGEPIIIANDGTLLDGQHRLYAIIKSKMAQQCLVVSGVSTDAFPTIDTGKKRTASDAIATYDEKYQKYRIIIAAAVAHIFHFKTGEYKNSDRKVTDHNDVIKFLENNPRVLESVIVASGLNYAKKLCPASALAALHFLFSQKDYSLAKEFFEKLNSGEYLFDGHPVLTLRNKLADISMTPGSTKSRDIIPYIVKAWNLFRKKQSCKRLYLNQDAPTIIE
jgi:hypothetical protein